MKHKKPRSTYERVTECGGASSEFVQCVLEYSIEVWLDKLFIRRSAYSLTLIPELSYLKTLQEADTNEKKNSFVIQMKEKTNLNLISGTEVRLFW